MTMRKTWSALRCSIGRMLSWKTIVFTVLSAALYVTLLPYVHQEGASIEEVLLTLVGGFEYEEIIAFKLDELFVWTLLLMSYLRCVSIAMQEEYDGRCKDTLYRFSSYQSWYMNQAIASKRCLCRNYPIDCYRRGYRRFTLGKRAVWCYHGNNGGVLRTCLGSIVSLLWGYCFAMHSC